jgi:hypothetical protein
VGGGGGDEGRCEHGGLRLGGGAQDTHELCHVNGGAVTWASGPGVTWRVTPSVTRHVRCDTGRHVAGTRAMAASPASQLSAAASACR